MKWNEKSWSKLSISNLMSIDVRHWGDHKIIWLVSLLQISLILILGSDGFNFKLYGAVLLVASFYTL